MSSADAAVDELFALYAAHGESDYVGEAVTQLQHALQAAALAAAAGSSDAVIAGALLHDTGHLLGLAEPGTYKQMGDCGTAAHETIGSAFLARLGFPALTCDLTRRHVDAKRYLCWVDKEYHARLSEASRVTLGYQGGPMGEVEAAAFEADPLKDTIITMRTWDEAAKVVDAVVPSLESYRPTLTALIKANTPPRIQEAE